MGQIPLPKPPKDWKPTRKEIEREELGAYTTMALVAVIAIILVINLIFNI